MDDPAGASSQQREECWYGLLLTVAVPAKQVCSPVGDPQGKSLHTQAIHLTLLQYLALLVMLYFCVYLASDFVSNTI